MPKAGKGKAKAKPKQQGKAAAAAAAKAAANAVFVWAQCDNAGCQKWRKLPPGTKIDDDQPWSAPRAAPVDLQQSEACFRVVSPLSRPAQLPDGSGSCSEPIRRSLATASGPKPVTEMQAVQVLLHEP